MNYSSSCQCGKVQVHLTLPSSIENYEPRECDCDFCQRHRITYISDPGGSLSIKSDNRLKQSKQGSEQAVFWQCLSCNNLIAVTNSLNGELKGAVNGQLFASKYKLGTSVIVSPKFLSSTEKRARWNSAWLRVKFNALSNT